MDTIVTNKIPVTEREFKDYVYEKMVPTIRSFYKSITELIVEISNLDKERQSVYLCGHNMYYDLKLRVLIPNLDGYVADVVESSNLGSIEEQITNKLFQNLEAKLPTLTQLKSKRALLNEMYDDETYIACVCDDKCYSNYLDLEVAYSPSADTVTLETHVRVLIIPVINLEYRNTNELLMQYLIPFGLCPDNLTDEAMFCLSDMTEIYKLDSNIIRLSDVGKRLVFGYKSLIDEYVNNPESDLFKKLHWEFANVLQQYYEQSCAGEVEMNIKEELLNCEKIRADIDPYEERLLTDPNRGHWDLWIGQDEKQYTVEVADDMVARNPLCDINENGVIAIDFGTKSTIVVYQSDIEHSLPMGIGDGNLSKEPTPKRYENPTVMHFVDLESFLDDYASRVGRPKTKWEDLTISHTAIDQFSNSKSEEYYEYLRQIKQWAGQREKQFRVQSHEGDTYVLPAFLDLKEDDWNPIEIYAYYIGLYINNMRKGHGIFLDYYLSFPVTYETKIREKIVRSFEKGLKKSLPASIVNNDEIMKKFHVNGGISEPTAYAVCALQEYGFEPEDDEEIFYGIFDFGGGTTDFDFGLWKQSSKRRYDYTIENFGAGGDEYLGGENLLEMLAFEVFKENQTMMREKGFTFTLAPKCTEFLGSDSLLADSQEAEKNMHNLMEKLRPYWEGVEAPITINNNDFKSDIVKISRVIEDECKVSPYGVEISDELKEILSERSSNDLMITLDKLYELMANYDIQMVEDIEENDELKLVVTLFDKEGNDQANELLNFSKKKLEAIIEKRIREGVNNFFSALLLSYQNDKVRKPTTVNILLAGNSCKSPVVKKVFEEEIYNQERQVKERYNISFDVGKLFEIFPPLGTEEAYKKMEEKGILVSRDDFEKPTGKTGVAFGLIQCRAGGVIERVTNFDIDDEIPFQYFIGWRSKKRFVLFKDDSKITKYKGKPDYNTWYKFIEADDSVFDLYYTTLPECVSGELIVDGNPAVKRLRCDIDVVNEDAFVFIRVVDPHTIEYVVAKNDDVDNSKLGQIVRKEM